jgi:hypothetical protein
VFTLFSDVSPCGAQIGTELHQGKLQIGKSGTAVVPAFVTELCFPAAGCEEIVAPPEVAVTRDFFVSRDFHAPETGWRNRLERQARMDTLAKTRGAGNAPKIHRCLHFNMLWTPKLR